MKSFKLENMIKGWFIGNFYPTALETQACEVAIKKYSAGDFEDTHYHKLATEVTLIVSGQVKMAGQVWFEGDIIVLFPNEETDFLSITDAITVVVKYPGASNDKYITQKFV